MPFHRTDQNKINWPKNISSKERRHSRLIYREIDFYLSYNQPIIVACSGGLDSTVLAHAVAQTITLSGNHISKYMVYVNHQLRPQSEIDKDITSVTKTANDNKFYLYYPAIDIDTSRGGNVQEIAREKRYTTLALLGSIVCTGPIIFLAHHANDIVETRLFQFVTGRKVTGLRRLFKHNGATFIRPLLSFTRQDLEEYAKTWNIQWSEDSSNNTDKYSRNKIRHHLIPWIENNINPGVIKALSKI